MLKTPAFWYKKPGFLSTLLTPLGWLYSSLSTLLRCFSHEPYRAKVPVVSIGNFVLGGAGKTPTTMKLARLLKQEGFTPMIVTRGYGGRLEGPIQVNPKQHSYKDVGDEALLLCNAAPTFVSKDRKYGVKMAEEQGVDIILLDDALQNNSIVKDLSLAVIGQGQKSGNGRVFPAGPLREPMSVGLKKTDAIIYLGDDNYNHEGIPVISGRIQTQPFPLAGQKIIAFCGLGYPDKFKNSLEKEDCDVKGFFTFPDHHPYTLKDMECITQHAGDLPIVTTSKDFTRIPEGYKPKIHVMDIEVNFDNPREILKLLR